MLAKFLLQFFYCHFYFIFYFEVNTVDSIRFNSFSTSSRITSSLKFLSRIFLIISSGVGRDHFILPVSFDSGTGSIGVGSISVKVREGEDMKIAEEKLRALLRQRHRLGPDSEEDFIVRNLTEMLQAQEASSRIMTILLAAVASVSLLVCSIS